MARKDLFPIGEVSKLFHISVSSLRHYETLGLLTPAYIAPDSGYRYYGAEQFEALNTIRYLRALDMPLSEIKDFLQNRDIDRVEEKLRQQRQGLCPSAAIGALRAPMVQLQTPYTGKSSISGTYEYSGCIFCTSADNACCSFLRHRVYYMADLKSRSSLF